MSLQAYPVDPRDVSAEIDSPVFRLYFWRPARSLACREFEVTTADVDEVNEWADRNQQEGETYVLGVLTPVRDSPPDGPGMVLTRIKGADPVRRVGDAS